MDKQRFNRLLKKMQKDENAFREVYEYYLPKIKYRVYSKFGGKVDFEDVAHDLFTRLLRLAAPPEVENPNAWIYRICDNISCDRLRGVGTQLPLDEIPEGTYSSYDGEILSDGEMDFFSLISMLDGESATIVKLVIWDDYSLKEVASMLGIKHGTARQKYSRALIRLRAYIKDIK